MSSLEENSFFDSGASVSTDCEAGSGPTTRPPRAPRSPRENGLLPLCSRAGGGLCVLGVLCVKMCSAFVFSGGRVALRPPRSLHENRLLLPNP